ALAFSWVAVLVGTLAKDPEKVQVFGFTAMFPLTFVSNVFVPAATMPGWLQAWVKINPVTVLADACRGLLVGGPVAGPVLKSVLWAAAIAVVFAPLAVWAFKRRVWDVPRKRTNPYPNDRKGWSVRIGRHTVGS